MNPNPIITYWQEKAEENLASAEDNFRASRLSNAVRDAYMIGFSIIDKKPIIGLWLNSIRNR